MITLIAFPFLMSLYSPESQRSTISRKSITRSLPPKLPPLPDIDSITFGVSTQLQQSAPTPRDLEAESFLLDNPTLAVHNLNTLAVYLEDIRAQQAPGFVPRILSLLPHLDPASPASYQAWLTLVTASDLDQYPYATHLITSLINAAEEPIHSLLIATSFLRGHVNPIHEEALLDVINPDKLFSRNYAIDPVQEKMVVQALEMLSTGKSKAALAAHRELEALRNPTN